ARYRDVREAEHHHARRPGAQRRAGLQTPERRRGNAKTHPRRESGATRPMRIGNTIQISFRALRRNKLRSLLTALGIIIGVGAVIALVSMTNGTKTLIQSQIASLGENVILIYAGNFSPGGVRSGWGGAGTLMVADAEAIQREIPRVTSVSPEVRGRAQ